MKNVIKNIALAVALFISATTTVNSQDLTHIREVALTDFSKIQVSLDTEVLVVKSKRNHVTLVGDSSFIASVPVIVKDEILGFNYETEPDYLLEKVVIEYTDIDHATTGGIGTYFFHNIEEDRLVVFNPYARVILSGNTNHIRVVSQEGITDVTALTSNNEALYIGEEALLVANKTN